MSKWSEARKKTESGKDVINRIREEKQREIIVTGKHWIPTADGIPIAQLTTEELKILFSELIRDPAYNEQALERIEVLDLLTSKRYKAKELMERYNINWRCVR